jgi:hypothetical protein
LPVGAIRGRLITAWSVAGVAGPALIARLREVQLNSGIAKNLVYDRTLYIMAALLVVGLLCNSFVRPLHEKRYMTEEELTRERSLQHEDRATVDAELAARGTFGALGVVARLAVGIPFFIGLYIALEKAAALF